MQAPTLRASSVAFDAAGDTLRVHLSDRAPWTKNAMCETNLYLDAQGFLVAIELLEGEAPAVIFLGPREASATRVSARVLLMDSGSILVTMAQKRVRGGERHPYIASTI